jgi:hypothetical protein
LQRGPEVGSEDAGAPWARNAKAKATFLQPATLAKGIQMSTQIVMDDSGDTRHEFKVADREALERAEARFRELTARGYRAVALGGSAKPGEGRLLHKFDPSVEQTLFIPQLQGG